MQIRIIRRSWWYLRWLRLHLTIISWKGRSKSLSLFSPGRDKGIQKGLECPAGVHEPPFEPPMQWRLANDQRLQTILYFYPWLVTTGFFHSTPQVSPPSFYFIHFMIALANIMWCLDFSLGDHVSVYSSTTLLTGGKNAMFEKGSSKLVI